MLILALDTTTRGGSAAVLRDDSVLAVLDGDAARTHGERLPGELAEVLRMAGVALQDIELLAVARGPGAFTGLRIGLAAMQALAMVTSVALLLWYEALSGSAVIAWGKFPKRIRPLLPLLLVVFCVYWIIHLVDAVRRAKSELVDVRNPIARFISERFSDSQR